MPLRARYLSQTSSSVSLSLGASRRSLSLAGLALLPLSTMCGHSKFPHRPCWLPHLLRSSSDRRLFSFLHSDLSGFGLQRDAASWHGPGYGAAACRYRPGYGAVEFVHAGSWSFEEAPGDSVVEGSWWEVWLQWLRRAKQELSREVVNFSCSFR